MVMNPQTITFDYLCSSLIDDISGDTMGLKSSSTLHLHGREERLGSGGAAAY